MRKLQMKRREFKGEITVFLSLVFVLLLSFIGGMIQSASIHITKSEKRADTKLALESVFAEYQSKMQEEYGIFAKLDGDETRLSRRLWFYGAKNMKHEIQKIQFLTDENGQAFYEQAIRAMGGNVDDAKEISILSWEEQEQDVKQQLDSMLNEAEQSLPTENNPIQIVENLKKSSLLTIVLENPETVSNRYVVLEELPSHRSLAEGTGFTATSKSGVSQKALFTAYLVKYFPNYIENKTENSLFYEAEYLLEGQESDRENLESVLQKISVIRTGVNYAYLLTDQTKQAEAEAMAAGLSSLLLIPEATPLIKQAILFAWAYGEGIYDLRTLAQGKKVPITKTQETWQLSLENLMKLGTEEEALATIEDARGIGYEDHVKAFLLAEKTEQLCMRALDLMELKLGIRMDACVTYVQIKSTCEMQLGIQDTFLTEYKYQ